jgi:excisionase family DNA binding protein
VIRPPHQHNRRASFRRSRVGDGRIDSVPCVTRCLGPSDRGVLLCAIIPSMTDQTPNMSSGVDSERVDMSPLSIRQAVDIAGVTEKTIRRWIHNGRLVAHKVGGQYAIDPAALDLARLDSAPPQPSRHRTSERPPTPQAPHVQTTEGVDTGQSRVDNIVNLAPLADLIERQTSEIRRWSESATMWQIRAMQAEERLKQLTSGDDEPQPRTEPQEASGFAPGEEKAANRTPDTSHESRPWWRRLLGGD